MQDGDVVAVEQDDARYVVRRWLNGVEVQIKDHDGIYSEADMRGHLDLLRESGDTWVRYRNGRIDLIQP